MTTLDALICCACGFLTILSFLVGVLIGFINRKTTALLPIEPTVPDEFKRLQYEADQKAFTDCMNYSAEIAYNTPPDP